MLRRARNEAKTQLKEMDREFIENEKQEAELTDPFLGDPEEEGADKNKPILK